MHLTDLSLVNFKNYPSAEFEFSPEVNCLVGDNGAGKTTVLDAIYYLSFCKSYFNPTDVQNIRHGQDFFMAQGHYSVAGETDKLHLGVKRGHKKSFKRNDKEYTRLAEHIGRYPAVIITPGDADLIREGSEVRRKFIDGIIAQSNRGYLTDLLAYNKALNQRNLLLKHFYAERRFDAESLEIWDVQLASHGDRIADERGRFMEQFAPLFAGFYADISGQKEQCTVSLSTEVTDTPTAQLLAQSVDKDRQAQRTTRGIHKDEMELLIDGYSVKRYGSQGQQKSLLIALKLAQFEFVKAASGQVPLLLLDDIFDKIDDKRVGYLMDLVSAGRFGQLFITDTHARRVPELFDKVDCDLRIFEIDALQEQPA